jgi:hypothetical protein
MNIWYCAECGDYHFSEPNTEKPDRGRVHLCPFCKTMSIVPLHEKPSFRDLILSMSEDDGSLSSFARTTQQEFPNLTFDDPRPQYRPLNYLIKSLNRTKHFIHIVTESIDSFFMGMLAMKHFESDIEITVIVWHPQKMYPDLERMMEHSTFVKGYEKAFRPFARGIRIITLSETHQKLIILDGCLAFYGSANATFDGWSREGELIKFTTDINEIRDLNHKYFSKFVVKKLHLPQNGEKT